MASIAEVQQQLIDDFALLPEWDERYAYLIELGQAMPPLDEAFKTAENLVQGCQSKVWFHTTAADGKIILHADSDSLIVKGIAAILVQVLSNRTPQEVLSADLQFLEDIGLRKHLSSQRTNGLLMMIEHIRHFAQAHTA